MLKNIIFNNKNKSFLFIKLFKSIYKDKKYIQIKKKINKD